MRWLIQRLFRLCMSSTNPVFSAVVSEMSVYPPLMCMAKNYETPAAAESRGLGGHTYCMTLEETKIQVLYEYMLDCHSGLHLRMLQLRAQAVCAVDTGKVLGV